MLLYVSSLRYLVSALATQGCAGNALYTYVMCKLVTAQKHYMTVKILFHASHKVFICCVHIAMEIENVL